MTVSRSKAAQIFPSPIMLSLIHIFLSWLNKNSRKIKTLVRNQTGVSLESISNDTALGFPCAFTHEVAGLEGAVYEVRAAEDISTPDGTLRYSKGEVVDTCLLYTSSICHCFLLWRSAIILIGKA